MSTKPRQSKPAPREVALAIRLGIPHLERVAHGIRQYARTRTSWRFLVSPETHDLPPAALKGWSGDGVIALCNTDSDERVLRSLRCPVVNISGALRTTKFPRVRNDYREIGRMGAAFLRGRGFRRFGFYGVEDVWYSEQIEAGFREFADELKFPVEVLHSANTMEGVVRWDEGQEDLERWLLSLAPPFAVMAAHDPRAAMVIRGCERVRLNVPRDVAVLGVNEDTVTCETCHPSLTSIERNGFEVGWRAAETLDKLMRGKRVPEELVIPPGKVCERESCRTLAVDSPELAEAIRFVESHCRKPLGVEQIAAACGRSRRWLEEAFRRELNCSPADFLRRQRVQLALRRLAEEPGVPLGVLAQECGFSGTRQLNAAFKREQGKAVRELEK